jgi:hypothetical protein
MYERWDRSKWELGFASRTTLVTFARERVERRPGGAFRTWFKWDFSMPQKTQAQKSRNFDRFILNLTSPSPSKTPLPEESFAYYLAKTDVDCGMLSNRVIELVYYDSGGKVVESWKSDDPDSERWLEILPGSIGEAAFNRFCENVKLSQNTKKASPSAVPRNKK